MQADERDRSGPAARRSVPLLRRTHAHHRDLRRRLPPPANKACHRDQDRYLMSANMILPVIAHIPSRSTTGNATVWPDGCPPSHSRPHAAPKHGLRPASSKRASQTSDHNHVSPVPRRLRESARSAPNPHCATPPISTSRGFLLWRLSDDGRGASGTVHTGPSSETLHTFGLLHCNQTRTQPITLSVRASTIGSVEPCFSIRIARRFDRLTL